MRLLINNINALIEAISLTLFAQCFMACKAFTKTFFNPCGKNE